MRKERHLSPSQTARQIFKSVYVRADWDDRIDEIIANYNKMSHPHAKLIAGRLAKMKYRADVKEFCYPLRAQTKAKKMKHFTKVKGYV